MQGETVKFNSYHFYCWLHVSAFWVSIVRQLETHEEYNFNGLYLNYIS